MKKLIFALALIGSYAHAELPDWLMALNGQSSTYQGPNCFSLALAEITGLPEKRYVSSEELAFWLQSDQCQKLTDPSQKREGDVVVIYDGRLSESGTLDGTEAHAFIYMNESKAFSKNGFTQDAPYLVQDLKPILNLYGFDPLAWQKNLCLNDKAKDADCAKHARIFRCNTFKDLSKSWPIKARAFLKSVDQISASVLNDLKLGSGKLLDSDRSAYSDQITDLENQVVELQESAPKEDKFLWDALHYRLESLNQSVTDLNY